MKLKHWESHTDYFYTMQEQENNTFLINIFESVAVTKFIFKNVNDKSGATLDEYGNIQIQSLDIESDIDELIWNVITYE
jgi:hypothetical protein